MAPDKRLSVVRRLVGGLRYGATALLEVFFPRHCVVCDELLRDDEQCVCRGCLAELPRTESFPHSSSRMKRALRPALPTLMQATAMLRYQRDDRVDRIVWQLKYGDRSDLGPMLGRLMATELRAGSAFFRGIDLIVPVPLHRHKEQQRGYNQSTLLARGVSEVTGIAVAEHAVVRSRWTDTQTRMTPEERRDNMQGAFALRDADALRGKHVLIVDDVFTTGATATACALAVMEAGDVSLSVLTLTAAGRAGDPLNSLFL